MTRVDQARQDFPILRQEIRGKPLVYLDSAATTQKPRQVIEAIGRYYETENANVHRGVHTLSERATASYEGARAKVRRFLNAADDREIVFVRGTTEAINLVAQTFGRTRLNAGDAVVITAMEHHSNIVPWQMVCAERGAKLKVAPIDEPGDLRLEELERLLTPEVKLLSLVHVSNALGTVNPIKRICELAHARGIPVLVDGAQAVSHLPVDVRALGCDFYAVSAHKMFGPTGVGALYGRAELLESLPPYMGGGDMILSVTFEKTLYNRLPYKFEAGTPDIAGAVGFGAAVDYIESVGRGVIAEYEHGLLEYATAALERVPGLKLIGKARDRASVLSFVLRGGEIHPHDIGTVLDQEGIAIRTGHHCAQPLMQVYGVAATARASLALYNTRADVDALVKGLGKVLEVLG
ncbi:MAG TPA: cysteine desulfurase [Myxococcaceae bacterium]